MEILLRIFPNFNLLVSCNHAVEPILGEPHAHQFDKLVLGRLEWETLFS